MDWARILAYVTGMVDQELLARIEYLAVHGSAEKRLSTAGPSHYRSLGDHLFDHLVGGYLQRQRHIEAERLGSLEIYD